MRRRLLVAALLLCCCATAAYATYCGDGFVSGLEQCDPGVRSLGPLYFTPSLGPTTLQLEAFFSYSIVTGAMYGVTVLTLNDPSIVWNFTTANMTMLCSPGPSGIKFVWASGDHSDDFTTNVFVRWDIGVASGPTDCATYFQNTVNGSMSVYYPVGATQTWNVNDHQYTSASIVDASPIETNPYDGTTCCSSQCQIITDNIGDACPLWVETEVPPLQIHHYYCDVDGACSYAAPSSPTVTPTPKPSASPGSYCGNGILNDGKECDQGFRTFTNLYFTPVPVETNVHFYLSFAFQVLNTTTPGGLIYGYAVDYLNPSDPNQGMLPLNFTPEFKCSAIDINRLQIELLSMPPSGMPTGQDFAFNLTFIYKSPIDYATGICAAFYESMVNGNTPWVFKELDQAWFVYGLVFEGTDTHPVGNTYSIATSTQATTCCSVNCTLILPADGGPCPEYGPPAFVPEFDYTYQCSQGNCLFQPSASASPTPYPTGSPTPSQFWYMTASPTQEPFVTHSPTQSSSLTSMPSSSTTATATPGPVSPSNTPSTTPSAVSSSSTSSPGALPSTTPTSTSTSSLTSAATTTTTTTTSSSSSSSTSGSSSSGLSDGAIAGVVVGCVIGVILIAAILVAIWFALPMNLRAEVIAGL